jgi:hypothetical protein
MTLQGFALRAALIFVVATGFAAAPAFDSKPWLDDLTQVKAALIAGYANLQWAVTDRGADLPALFNETAARIQAAQNESDARAAFERFARRIGDGHIAFRWKPSGAPAAGGAPDFCRALGYDSAKFGAPVATYAQGYRALTTPQSAEFPAGLIGGWGHHIGILKIGLFEPQGIPALCDAAVKALAIATDKPCDDACATSISRWAHNRMTEDMAAQLRALKAAHADVLVVDIANNGGGSEWAEAAARMLTPKRLEAEQTAFPRAPGWAASWREQEADLRKFAADADTSDKAMLLKLANRAHANAVAAATSCDGEALWRGESPGCAWLLGGFYASGLLASADPATLRGKPFAETLYSPMQYPFEEGVWRGPLIVLVDRNSYSAAEEFAAELQDNFAAIIMGEPTGGAGCGHMLEGAEVTLKNSGAVLEMPDCARLRADGSNEIQGVEPDVLVGFTPRDGASLRGRRFLAKLDEAVAMALRGIEVISSPRPAAADRR